MAKTRKSAEDYQQAIQALDWAGLRALWDKIKKKRTPGWPPGKALEYLVLRAFELDKATVRYPYSVRLDGEELEQLDGAVHIGHLSCLVEAKDYGNEPFPEKETPVNFEPLAKMRSQLLRRPAQAIGAFFSTSDYTDPALILARYLAPQTILLWEKKHLEYALQKENICALLQVKYRHCVETGEPNFNVAVLAYPNSLTT